MKEKKFFIPILLALIGLAVLFFLVKGHQDLCPWCAQLKAFSPEVVKHYIQGFGALSLGVFILLYALNTISLLPPIGIMSLSAGFIFGPLNGTLAIMAGSFLGTTATFFISRIFGSHLVERWIKGQALEFREKLNQNGFKIILFIRLIPLVPWEVVNYSAGLSQMKYRDYILATLIGIFPAVIIQTFFADRISAFDLKDPALAIALGAFVFLGAMPVIYLKWQRNKPGKE